MMDNWEKIIRSCGQTDDKALKLIDATVLSVNSHSSLFESATVRLITGQIIKDLINASWVDSSCKWRNKSYSFSRI